MGMRRAEREESALPAQQSLSGPLTHCQPGDRPLNGGPVTAHRVCVHRQRWLRGFAILYSSRQKKYGVGEPRAASRATRCHVGGRCEKNAVYTSTGLTRMASCVTS
eukprot:6941121-Prymnesium_polylepis.1